MKNRAAWGGSRGLRILIVEDDRATQALLAGLLEANGYKVVTATRRAEALARFANKPSMILVDGLLPDGTGVDLISDANAAGLNVPVVFLTSFFKDNKSSKSLVETYGASADYARIFQEYGITGEAVAAAARDSIRSATDLPGHPRGTTNPQLHHPSQYGSRRTHE